MWTKMELGRPSAIRSVAILHCIVEEVDRYKTQCNRDDSGSETLTWSERFARA